MTQEKVIHFEEDKSFIIDIAKRIKIIFEIAPSAK